MEPRTDAAIREHGDEGLWVQNIWRDVWTEDTLVDALFGCSFAPGGHGDLAEGLTEAFIDTFGWLEQSQAEVIDGLPPARDFLDTAEAEVADDPEAGSESEDEAGPEADAEAG